jgi:hypothetical protein
MRMRRVLLSFVARLALQYFPRYLTTGTIFGKMFLNKKYLSSFSLQLLSETFLILRRTERDIITKLHKSLCTVPVIRVTFH